MSDPSASSGLFPMSWIQAFDLAGSCEPARLELAR
jgi:hypothetical protein